MRHSLYPMLFKTYLPCKRSKTDLEYHGYNVLYGLVRFSLSITLSCCIEWLPMANFGILVLFVSLLNICFALGAEQAQQGVKALAVASKVAPRMEFSQSCNPEQKKYRRSSITFSCRIGYCCEGRAFPSETPSPGPAKFHASF